jgi:nicotinate (nicotinamide) nucleotide adenylyltransferase
VPRSISNLFLFAHAIIHPMTTHTGILGGTFDPIHYGHLAIAEEARVLLGFERVLFVPAAQQPLKRNGHLATPAQRLEMARLACAGNPAFAVSPIEVERQGPSYTVDTLKALREADLGELHFILGADAAAELHRWHTMRRYRAYGDDGADGWYGRQSASSASRWPRRST